jgi:hypothetical protein
MAQDFKPPRQRGFVLHFGAMLLNLAIVGYFALQASVQQERGFFILYLIAAVIMFIPLPAIAYRLFALMRSRYTVDREGVSIQWGLREEFIPMADIEWIRHASELAFNLPLPPISMQGAVLGSRVHHDIGQIEFMASDASNLLLIAARRRVFAISPMDVRGYLSAFNSCAELGSIAPISGKSSSANFLVAAILKDKVARTLLLLGIGLSISLLITASFIIPLRDSIPLGFNPLGQVAGGSPSERLLLLPILSILMLVIDIGLGSYLYRKKNFLVASYIVFAASLIMPLSFFGIILILSL